MKGAKLAVRSVSLPSCLQCRICSTCSVWTFVSPVSHFARLLLCFGVFGFGLCFGVFAWLCFWFSCWDFACLHAFVPSLTGAQRTDSSPANQKKKRTWGGIIFMVHSKCWASMVGRAWSVTALRLRTSLPNSTCSSIEWIRCLIHTTQLSFTELTEKKSSIILVLLEIVAPGSRPQLLLPIGPTNCKLFLGKFLPPHCFRLKLLHSDEARFETGPQKCRFYESRLPELNLHSKVLWPPCQGQSTQASP